jgi:hypothetical protein
MAEMSNPLSVTACSGATKIRQMFFIKEAAQAAGTVPILGTSPKDQAVGEATAYSVCLQASFWNIGEGGALL